MAQDLPPFVVELKTIEWLKPYERNAREITAESIDKLCRAIEEIGFLDPIEVEADGTIIAGHRRWMAAKKMGLKRVPVIVHHMSKDEARAYRISHNRLSEDVKWARPILADELLQIETLISPEVLGFEDADLVKLFDLDGGPPEKTDDDAGDEPGPFIKRGERWEIGPVTFQVYPNLTDEGLRKAEAMIPRLEKLLKQKALLDGDESLTFKQVISERMAEAGVEA